MEENIQQESGHKQFEVHLSEFSGPLDLLCVLVETSQFDAVKLNVAELVSQYMNYLLNVRGATLNELADFFSFASRILLRKVRSLFNKKEETEPETDIYDTGETDDEISIRAVINRYKPYRKAAAILAECKSERERSFIRVTEDEDYYYYDIGDLETLALKWWELLALYDDKNRDSAPEFWEEIEDAAPEEQQIEERMSELMAILGEGRINLRDVLKERNPKLLIVTLLAMLELAHMGAIVIIQEETLGSVEIAANRH